MVTYAKRLTMFSLLILIAHLGMAYQPPPRVTISMKNATMQQVFDEINKQTGLIVFYSSAHLNAREKITLQFTNEQLDKVMNLILKDKPLSYEIDQKFILIKAKPDKPAADSQKAFSLPPSPLVENGPVDEAIPPIEIRGRVLDESGQPVAGASVLVKGTTNGTSTDANGYFTLTNVDEKATLVITSVNIEPIEVKVNGRSSITVSAKTAVKEEEIVVAYGTRTRTNNTGAVTVVKGEEIQNLPNRSFEKSLQGLVPGLFISKGNGQPGGAPGQFVLRGIATGGVPDAGQAFRNPLVVIDGVPVYQDPLKPGSSSSPTPSNPMAQLNPSDIESITVLKDAAAIALYGSRASNGVILVTTKKGKAGRTTFTFRQQTDISERMKDPEVLNQQEYLELLVEAYRNSNPATYPNEAAVIAELKTLFPVRSDGSFYPADDWNKLYYKKSAVTLVNELSMSGGNDRSNFYLNVEYTKQDGVVAGSGFDRKSMRFNYENRVTPWLKLGLNTTASYTIQNYQGGNSTISISPLIPVRSEEGEYINNYSWGWANGGAFAPNPVLAAKLNINRNTAYRSLSRLYGELTLLKGFTLSSSVGVDFILNENKEKVHPDLVLPAESTPGVGRIQDYNTRNGIIISTNILRFDKMLSNDHSINVMLGQEAQILSKKFSAIETRGFAYNPTAIEPSVGAIYAASSLVDRQTFLSYFGQGNYGFRNKYFLSGSVRTDGSSRFGDNRRFGTYWSAGGGWIISAEPFMKKTGDWLDYLKLRGSIGSAGNSAAIDGYLRFDQLILDSYLGNTVVLPDRNSLPGNPDIQWESTFSWDAGLEARFFNERLTVISDIYNRKTTQLISRGIILPATTGFFSYSDNIGDLKNSGVELAISAVIIKSKNFRWNLNANWSKNINKLVKAYVPEGNQSADVINKVGEAYNSFNLPRWASVNPVNGRPMWIDSTGKPSEDYYAAKREIVGKIQPDGFGSVRNSFSYKEFTLSVMFYYQYGFQIYLHNLLQDDGTNPYLNQSKAALNRWQKPGDIAVNPRRLKNRTEIIPGVGSVSDNGTNASTRYLFDGDFIRLSNISLAYNIPERIVKRLHLTSLSAFIQGHNLSTWTKYSGQDPENVGINGSGGYLYPQQRSFSVGLNLNF